MQQTKIDSFMEQVFNVGSGMLIAAGAWGYIIRPLIHNGYLTIDSTWPITIIFTVISLARGFFWRRIFNGKQPFLMVKRHVKSIPGMGRKIYSNSVGYCSYIINDSMFFKFFANRKNK